MADAADIAFEMERDRVSRGLATIVADMPAGVEGECEECGESMPRIVDGRCGFCRDGRRPPLSFYADRAAAPPAPTSPTKEHVPMALSEPVALGRKITIDGVALKAVEDRAATANTSWKQAADALILEAITRTPTPIDDASNPPMSGGILSVATVDELLEELSARFDVATSNAVMEKALHDAAARADAAESKLANLKSLLTA